MASAPPSSAKRNLPVLSEGHDRGLYQAIGRSVFGCLVAHKGDGDGVDMPPPKMPL